MTKSQYPVALIADFDLVIGGSYGNDNDIFLDYLRIADYARQNDGSQRWQLNVMKAYLWWKYIVYKRYHREGIMNVFECIQGEHTKCLLNALEVKSVIETFMEIMR